MPQLTYTTFEGAVHTHELKPGTTRIGRTPDNDLQIDELAVSSHHCEIRYAGGTIVVKDLDSISGTSVEGEPITEHEIKVGQVLGLGAFLLQLKASEAGSTGPALRPPPFKPVQLADGSYSCLRHPARRAVFECQECFDLACEECARSVAHPDGAKETFCRSCGAEVHAIDWSGLTLGKKEVLISLLPGGVQKALDYWAKRQRGPRS